MKGVDMDEIYPISGLDLAEWLERLAVNVKVAKSPGLESSILRHSGIRGAADEAVLNNVHKKKKSKKSPIKRKLILSDT